MTQVVVTDQHNTVVVGKPTQTTTVITGIMGPPGRVAALSEVPDVDVTNLQLGSILVYNPSVSKWVSTTLLNQQQVDCGEF